MKIRTFDFPKFEEWYKTPNKLWEQEIGKYSCLICEMLGTRGYEDVFYSFEISYKVAPYNRHYIFCARIKAEKSYEEIKAWFEQSVVKAAKTWENEITPYIAE